MNRATKIKKKKQFKNNEKPAHRGRKIDRKTCQKESQQGRETP